MCVLLGDEGFEASPLLDTLVMGHDEGSALVFGVEFETLGLGFLGGEAAAQFGLLCGDGLHV